MRRFLMFVALAFAPTLAMAEGPPPPPDDMAIVADSVEAVCVSSIDVSIEANDSRAGIELIAAYAEAAGFTHRQHVALIGRCSAFTAGMRYGIDLATGYDGTMIIAYQRE